MKGIKNTQASYNNKKAKKSTDILGNFITLHSTIVPAPFRACNPQVYQTLVQESKDHCASNQILHPLSQCLYSSLWNTLGYFAHLFTRHM